jgi:uncharacterized protein (TIGR03435 family)
MRRRVGYFALAAITSTVLALAQPQLPKRPEFEVAAIHLNTTATQTLYAFGESGRFTATAPVKTLMQLAYGIKDFQISGDSAWLSTNRYSIEANGAETVSQSEIFLMLRSLLEDRFGLVTHNELKNSHVYDLVVTDKLRLQHAKPGQCFVLTIGVPPPPPLPGESDPWVCGRIYPFPMQLFGKQVSMPGLAEALSRRLGSAVIDKTGLDDKYDLSVKWTLENIEAHTSAETAGSDLPTSVVPVILNALREQTGLKLQSSSDPVNFTVIDTIHRPSAN